MAVAANMNGSGYMAVPGGYPLRLWAGGDTTLSGVLPKSAQSVTATLAAEAATCNAHMAIYVAPLLSSDNDQALVQQVDLLGLAALSQAFTLTVPTSSLQVATIPAGTISLNAGSSTVTGSGTAFDSSWTGYQIQAIGDTVWYTIKSVASTTSLTLAVNSAITKSSGFYFRPASVQPFGYTFRLWVDSITGNAVDANNRAAGGGYVVANNPNMPTGVKVLSIVVS